MDNTINWKIYRELNPDLIKARLNMEHQLLNHWVKSGHKENRMTNINHLTPDFDWDVYRILNPDLVFDDQIDYELHWIRTGRFENRKYYDDENKQKIMEIKKIKKIKEMIDGNDPNAKKTNMFNWKIYYDLNIDIRRIGIKTQTHLENHYNKCGIKEKKAAFIFDVYPDFNHDTYLHLNPELKNLNIISKEQLEEHWILQGRKQGLNYKQNNFMPSFHILIASNGRKTIIHQIRSLIPQLLSNDYITIVFDGPQSEEYKEFVSEQCKKFKCKVNIIIEPYNLGFYGHGIRNKHNYLEGDFIMHADDDDFYLPNSFKMLRKLCNDPDMIYIFMFEAKTGRNIFNTEFKVGSIGTPAGIIPQKYNTKGYWGLRNGGDGDFYIELSNQFSKNFIFIQEHIYTANIISNHICNWNIYKELNPDLQYKMDEQYKNHWKTIGFYEGRNIQVTDVYADFEWEKHKSLSDNNNRFGIELKWLKENHPNSVNIGNNITNIITNNINKQQYSHLDNTKKDHRARQSNINTNDPLFNWEIYKELNPDLPRAGLHSESQITTHWKRFCQRDNRKYNIYQIFPNFDWIKYKESNPELSFNGQTDYELHWTKQYMKQCDENEDAHGIINENYNYIKTIPNGPINNNIGFLIKHNNVGGTEYVTYQHIKYAQKLGYNPILISCETGMFHNKSKELGIKCYIAQLHNLSDTECIQQLDNMLGNCMMIYVCNYQEIFPKLEKYKVNKNIEYTVIVHSSSAWCLNIIKRFNNIINKVICIHNKIKNKLIESKISATKLFTLPNWIECDNIPIKNKLNGNGIKSKYNISMDATVIGMITRIAPDKNVISAINILNKLVKIDNFHLLIIGDGNRSELMRAINNHKLENKVTITGYLDSQSIYDTCNAIDICINTSTIEGLPISLLEQMSMGIYTIYPSVGEIQKVIGDCCSIIKIMEREGGTYTNNEENLFVNEIIRVYKSDQISNNTKINNYIKNTRDVNVILPLYKIILTGYTDGLSFIIRARNEEENVEMCLKSIVDIADEIIFVDHLSTDKTYEYACKIAENHKNIKVYKFSNEIPKCGNNYNKNIAKCTYSIADYYNYCMSFATCKNIVKWDCDFIANRDNLIEMIDKFNLKNKNEKFCLWFTGETLFIHDDKYYINTNSYYDEYRVYSKKFGYSWDDSIKCEFANPEYIRMATKYKYEKPCFYEMKRTNKNEFESRESLIDKRDINDNNIINIIKNNNVSTNANIIPFDFDKMILTK